MEGLNGANGIALSADGNHAYVTGSGDDAVSWYERNASTGALTYVATLQDGANGVEGLMRGLWNHALGGWKSRLCHRLW